LNFGEMSYSSWFLLGLAVLLLAAALFIVIRVSVHWIANRRAGGTKRSSETPHPYPLEAPQFGVLCLDSDGRVLITNRAAQTLLDLQTFDQNIHSIAHRARPNNALHELFEKEGRTHIFCHGRTLEVESHLFSDGDPLAALFLLRPTEKSLSSREDASEETLLRHLLSLLRDIPIGRDLDTTIRGIHQSVRRLLPADLIEVTLRDAQSESFIPHRASGNQDQAFTHLGELTSYRIGEGYTGWLLEHRAALFLPDVDACEDPLPIADREQFPFNAYMGVPLLLGNELVGTLEVASFKRDAYLANDLAMLEILALQATIALHQANRRVFQEARSVELGDIHSFVAEISGILDESQLIARMTRGVASMLDSNILGILSWDPENQHLLGRPPFVGLPTSLVEKLCDVPIEHGSLAYDTLLMAPSWVCNDPAHDTLIDKFGMRRLIREASIHNLLSVPLLYGEQKLGILLAANKGGRLAFEENDVRLLSILSTISSASLRSAQLERKVRRDSAQMQGLTGVLLQTQASQSVLDSTLSTLRAMHGLSQADATLLLLCDSQDEGSPTPSQFNLGFEEEHLQRFIEGHGLGPCLTVMRGAFRSSTPAEDQGLDHWFRRFAMEFELQRLMIIPINNGDEILGNILLGRESGAPFSKTEQEIACAAAANFAGELIRHNLLQKVDKSNTRHMDQLATLTRAAERMLAAGTPQELLACLHAEAMHVLGATGGHSALLDPEDGTVRDGVLAQVGEANIEDGLSPLQQAVLDQAQFFRFDDVQTSEYGHPRPDVHALLIGPLLHKSVPVGLIEMYAEEPSAFDSFHQGILEPLSALFSIQLTHLLSNQQVQTQLHESEQRKQKYERLLHSLTSFRVDQPLDLALETIAVSLEATLPFKEILIRVYQPQTGLMLPMASAGIQGEKLRFLQDQTPTWEALRKAHLEWQTISQSYWRSTELGQQDGQYQDESPQLDLPLYGIHGDGVGVLSLWAPTQVVDRGLVAWIEFIAAQVAAVIENSMLYMRTKSRLKSISEKLLQVTNAHSESSRLASDLLQEEETHKAELVTLQGRHELIQSLVEALTHARVEATPEEMVQRLVKELQQGLELKAAIVLQPAPQAFELQAVAIEQGFEIAWDTLLRSDPALEALREQEEPVLITEMEAEPWAQSALIQTLEATCIFFIPLHQDEPPHQMVLLFTTQSPCPFGKQDLRLYTSLLNQLYPQQHPGN